MAILGRTERRLALAIVLMAGVPLIAALFFSWRISRFLAPPEFGEYLDQTVGVYHDLANALKEGMRYEADAIAAREPLRAAALRGDEGSVRHELDLVFPNYPNLVSLAIGHPDGTLLAQRTRSQPFDETQERARTLRVPLPFSGNPDPPTLIATFTAPRARFDEVSKTGDFVRTYHEFEHSRTQSRFYVFALALVGTIIIAVGFTMLLALSITRRIGALADATRAVAAGDLRVRVPERGNDELTDLSRGFNRMLSEMEVNRARVDFLQRMSTWQEMARRLAHEIKNPLTPILLAVEECHRKYAGNDPAFRKLLDTTLEIVEEEVGTLRRLVGEFSSFARLPRADLVDGDLADFMREQKEHALLLMGEQLPDETPATGSVALPAESAPDAPRPAMPVAFTFEIPDVTMPAALDRQMLHQVLTNIVRNAAQAIVATGGQGHIRLRVVEDGEYFAIIVDDDGPGVPADARPSVFDPYFTTKSDGTGLGLAIVKKIVVEHGGTIDVGESDLGGASFRIRIPRLSSPAARAVQEMRPSLPPSGVRSP